MDGDKIQIRARGVGLKIDGFEDVRVNKMAPEFLDRLSPVIEGGQLVVPVVMEVPGHIMGSGMGGSFIETGDYDIQGIGEISWPEIRIDTLALLSFYVLQGIGEISWPWPLLDAPPAVPG